MNTRESIAARRDTSRAHSASWVDLGLPRVAAGGKSAARIAHVRPAENLIDHT
jgi:hypothetical protein